MRTLARRTAILIEAAENTGIDAVSGSIETLLSDLARDVIQVRIDLIHFPITYFFHSDRRRFSLPHSLPYLLQLAETGSRPESPERVRLGAAILQVALQGLARLISNPFIHAPTDNPEEVFSAYADAHAFTGKQD
jgi:hypothetical protein